MKDNNSYSDSLWVDYKSIAETSKASSKRGWSLKKKAPAATESRQKLRSLPGISGGSSGTNRHRGVQGAVRIKAKSDSAGFFNRGSSFNLRQMGLAGVAMACGVALLANATTSNNTSSRFKSIVLTKAQAPDPAPTFRFDDAHAVNSETSSAVQVAMVGRPSNQVFFPQTFASLTPEVDSTSSAEALLEEIVESTFTPVIHQPTDEQALLPESFSTTKQKTITDQASRDADITESLITQALAKAPDLRENYHQKVVVAAGNTFSGILNKQGIPTDQINKLLTNDIVKEHLTNLRIGNELDFEYRWNGDLDNISVKINRDTRVRLQADGDALEVATVNLPIEYERVVTSGTIEQSLYLAAEKAQLKQSTIMELANIFEWELDFARDIRKGDNFSIVYDRLYRDGKYIGDGDILAAEFVRGDRRHSAIRFTDDEGNTEYYSPDGQSKRRTFMRHPVDVVRITSRFDPNRLHPVLHKIRAHRGVDYGAPHGSPIYATADGKVSFSGSKGAYGKTVILKHGENRTTLYAHMSRIATKSKMGKRVKRGDVIGYVGKTGRVTGTHLHYEFRVAGKHVDPLKVRFPSAKPLDKKYQARLKAVSNELVAQMRSVLKQEQQVAKK